MSPGNFTENKELVEAVKASLAGVYLPCPAALKLAARFKVEPGLVGDITDRLGARITDCQLGCFKVEKAKHDDLDDRLFSRKVTEGIQIFLVDGRLQCTAAHRLSREIKVSLREIGDAASRMKVKISQCQLNCFP